MNQVWKNLVLIDKNGGIRDISDHIPDLTSETVSKLDQFKNIDIESLPIIQEEKRIGPCVGSVGKFVCIGLNYSDHAAESGMEVPPEPVVFMKRILQFVDLTTRLLFHGVQKKLIGKLS